MARAIPLEGTIHMDAYRDIDTSWETDEAGYIAEDEEFACGCVNDRRWLGSHHLSLGVEGSNGMASVGGPNPPGMGVFNYYWHGHMGLGDWARIIAGSDQGLDDDITPSSTTNPFNHWGSLADSIYLKAKPLALRMTDPELLSDGKFLNGGTNSVWPHGDSLIEYFRPGAVQSVFVPEVLPPPAGSAKVAPTTINPNKIYAYLQSTGKVGQHSWQIPSSWTGRNVTAETITPTGRVAGPQLAIKGESATFEMQPGQPIVLTAGPKQ